MANALKRPVLERPSLDADTVASGRGARLRLAALCLVLAALTFAVFAQTAGFGFVNYDDDRYVYENPVVAQGLTWEGVKSAFVNPVCANWQPLTVLSHMLVCQVVGLKPSGHHLINVLLHALNAALVFALLQQMTGATWRSLLAAALFALHPLRVESVAWVAELKDVLSGCFGLLALMAYARYAAARQKSECRVQDPASGRGLPGAFCYVLSLLLFALGLMSKPTLVTWPFVMLLLDYWPLERFKPGRAWRLVREKIPFLILAAAASVVTFLVQRHAGSLVLNEALSLGARSENALVSYCGYLRRLFWPTDLAVFYPHPGQWPLEQVLLAGTVLVGASLLLFVQRRRYPFLFVGWLWFLGMLVPMIGLVQTGGQALADRHTYLSSLGVLILAAWGGYELTRRWQHHGVALSVAGAAVIVLCVGLTRRQLGYWKDGQTLWIHTLGCTSANYLAHYNLGMVLQQEDKVEEAIRHYQTALQIKPSYADAHLALGNLFLLGGRTDEAIACYQSALPYAPDDAQIQGNLGIALRRSGRTDEAISHLQTALQLAPADAPAHVNLGIALFQQGKFEDAMRQFQSALQIKPDDAGSHFYLGRILARRGEHAQAIAEYQLALKIEAGNPEFKNNLAWLLVMTPQAALRNGDQALLLAREACALSGGPNPSYLRTLAAAFAEVGRFSEARESAQKAIELARAAGKAELAARLDDELKDYEAGRPIHP